VLLGISSGDAVVLAIVIISGLFLYMLPTFIGMSRQVVNVGSVFAVNLLFGWSLVGWAVALAMALRTNPPHAHPQFWENKPLVRMPANTPPPPIAGPQTGRNYPPSEIVKPGDMRQFDEGWARYDSSGRWIYVTTPPDSLA
jgi:hypothetical protein